MVAANSATAFAALISYTIAIVAADFHGINPGAPESCFNTSTGTMTNFKQCDPRWKCFPYAGQAGLSTCSSTACEPGGPENQTNNICGSGCGITSTAMVLTYFGNAVIPTDVAKYFIAEGFRNDLTNNSAATCNGVSHEAICDGANHWGLSCSTSSSLQDLDTWLGTGPVIAHLRHRATTAVTSCKFTKGGHYIVITARKDPEGRYSVSDPNSCEASNAKATAEELTEDCQLVGILSLHRSQELLQQHLVV